MARQVYDSIYFSVAEQFKLYLDSLDQDEIDHIENDIRANCNERG